ncbi:sialidase family protein [Streptomyces sp. SM14]|uniref:sialidase family protein n=2 Tax=unclassified Streptomyces TaxID=2593676 RepID=UPI0011B0BEC1|nr:sialidase family protein [Streptomyces sp. SM14]
MATEAKSATVPDTTAQNFCVAVNQDGVLSATTFDSNNYWGELQRQDVGITGSPALVNYYGRNYCVHQGAGDGKLWYGEFTWDAPRLKWLFDAQVSPEVSVSGSPAVAVYEGLVYCVYRGSEDMLYCVSFDGTTWSEPTKVTPEIKLTANPSLAVFREKLYCAYQQSGGSGWIYYASFDGKSWTGGTLIENYGMSASPALIEYRGYLWILHQEYGDRGWLWSGFFDGVKWGKDTPVADVGMADSPALTVSSGDPETLYCLHRGRGGNRDLWLSRYNGTEWFKDQVKIQGNLSASPGVVRIA